MKIKLLKNHLDHTAGETIEVTEQRGGYLIRVGVGKESKERKQTKELKEPVSTKLGKPRKDGVTSTSTPEAHDTYIKSLNNK